MGWALHFKRAWLSFDSDLAWDIFTLDCMLVALIAMVVAAGAGLSSAFSELVADYDHWLWSVGAAMAIVAVVCLVRCVAGRTRYPWEV